MQKISLLVILILITIVVLFGAGFLYFVSYAPPSQLPPNNTTPPPVPSNWPTYSNTDYGFQITFPDSWQGYSVIKSSWTGYVLDNSGNTVTGPLVTFRNPHCTAAKHWQDI